MADVYELLINADLPDDLSEAELNELRWHLGLGPEPTECTIVTDFPMDFVDEDGELADYAPGAEGTWEESRRPALAGRGAAGRIGGVLFSDLRRRERNQPRPGWALTSRQEVHPGDFEGPEQCISWLTRRVLDPQFDLDVYLRFYEDTVLEPAFLDDGQLVRRKTRSQPPSPQVLRLIADDKHREAVVQAGRDTGMSLDEARHYVGALGEGRVIVRA
ncbi:hypothetical protein ACTWQF_11650 [Streptomyces sp. 8N114]|uniref:hypothetical protein n=1 Tax=Streptomyces sp. 8N114 TaxID=3457419 RepID=UPI003FD577B8